MKEYYCQNCGKYFIDSHNKNRRFCCQKCANDYRKSHKSPIDLTKRVKVECAECHKVEYVAPSRARKYKCCSVECLAKYNAKRYSQKVELICPICGDKYQVKRSKVCFHKTCGKKECRHEWLSRTRKGKNNSNYRKVELDMMEQGINQRDHGKSKTEYLHVVKSVLKLNSVTKMPKGYVIHHKDANHFNNMPTNLVVLPKTAHRLIHTWFGNVLINALHTEKINRETFFTICNEEQRKFYENIIDLDVTKQAVVKQGELLENLDEGDQQLSIYRNIYESSTTNSRVLTNNVEDGNADTSALPINIDSDDIV